jgi:hypothetical protein
MCVKAKTCCPLHYTPILVLRQCLLLALYRIALLVLKRIHGATGLFCLAFLASFFFKRRVFWDGCNMSTNGRVRLLKDTIENKLYEFAYSKSLYGGKDGQGHQFRAGCACCFPSVRALRRVPQSIFLTPYVPFSNI